MPTTMGSEVQDGVKVPRSGGGPRTYGGPFNPAVRDHHTQYREDPVGSELSIPFAPVVLIDERGSETLKAREETPE